MIHVRAAISLDTPSMARLLNANGKGIGAGAHGSHVKPADIADWMCACDWRTVWHVALDETEDVVGFQWIAPAGEGFASDVAEIATFVETGQSGLDIGSKLFEMTKHAAKSLGYRWINATVGADNEGGLIYYQSRGFVPYGAVDSANPKSDVPARKILKRFDL